MAMFDGAGDVEGV